jgi:hypothetical protein
VTSLSLNQSKLMDHDATATAISSPRRSRSRSGCRTLLNANSALLSGLPKRLKETHAAQLQMPCAALPRNVIAAASLPELGVENVLPTKPKAMPKLRSETLVLEESILVRQTSDKNITEQALPLRPDNERRTRSGEEKCLMRPPGFPPENICAVVNLELASNID